MTPGHAFENLIERRLPELKQGGSLMKDVLVEFFRCPENSIEMELTGKLSDQSGFFRLGEDTICYGQTCAGPLASGPR